MIRAAFILLICVGLVGCKNKEQTKPDPVPVETSTGTDTTKETDATKAPPSKLDQPDWSSPPPGMPEKKTDEPSH